MVVVVAAQILAHLFNRFQYVTFKGRAREIIIQWNLVVYWCVTCARPNNLQQTTGEQFSNFRFPASRTGGRLPLLAKKQVARISDRD